MDAISLWQPYLAGVLHGDGWCGTAIGLRCKDLDFSAAFAAALNQGFSLGKVPKRDERGYWLVRVGNRSGKFNDLRAYEPESDEERAAWLRGLFDSEGNAQCMRLPRSGPNCYQRRIAFYSTEMSTLQRAIYYLDVLGIAAVIRPTKNSQTHKGTKIVYELKLTRKPAFISFSKIVGSSIARKQKTLEVISSSFSDPAIFTRVGQANGAAVRRKTMIEESLPSVVGGIRTFIATGIKPTKRACSAVVAGHRSILHHFRHSELVAMAMEAS